jgi:hypothetical protein
MLKFIGIIAGYDLNNVTIHNNIIVDNYRSTSVIFVRSDQ